jgi:hypothetical protein
MNINLGLLEQEHLIGRLKVTELLERQSPYREVPERVERRFSQALQMLPEDLREPALAVFGTAFYITRQMLEDAWRYLWSCLCTRLGNVPRQEDVLMLELDRDLLRDDFYRANSIIGRLEQNLPFRSAQDIVDALMQLEAGPPPPELRAAIASIARRPYWILLTDMCMSGGSASAELRRLRRLSRLLDPSADATLVALVQVVTDHAYDRLIAAKADFLSAIRVPASCALTAPNYSLISDLSLAAQIKNLCQWFAETHILTTTYRLAELSRRDNNPAIAYYGYGELGWNIITHKNAPNNSLPILWFRPPTDAYRPPFERIDSRVHPPWPGRTEWLDRLENDPQLSAKVRSELRQIVGVHENMH